MLPTQLDSPPEHLARVQSHPPSKHPRIARGNIIRARDILIEKDYIENKAYEGLTLFLVISSCQARCLVPSLFCFRVNSLKCYCDQKKNSFFSLDFKTMLTKH